MLINSLLAHANDLRWEEFISEVERLNVRKAVVVRLISSFSMASNLLPATHVIAHDDGRSHFVHTRFPSQHAESHLPKKKYIGRVRK